jgi:tetratricopeptide (TPR) repeat protein
MRKIQFLSKILALAFFLLPVFLSQAVANTNKVADSLVLAGNNYYLIKDYSNAIRCYQQVVDMGFEAPALFYNLGNAYYKQDMLAEAILYYEKALLLSPADEDIQQNLSLANTRIVDKIDSIPVFFLKRWFHGLGGILSPDQWAWLSFGLFCLALVAFLLYVMSQRTAKKKLAFSAGVFLVMMSLLGIVMMQNRVHAIKDGKGAIIMETSLDVKSSPDVESVNAFVLHAGTRVVIVDSVQHWIEVKIADGSKGWVSRDAISEI